MLNKCSRIRDASSGILIRARRFQRIESTEGSLVRTSKKSYRAVGSARYVDLDSKKVASVIKTAAMYPSRQTNIPEKYWDLLYDMALTRVMESPFDDQQEIPVKLENNHFSWFL